MKKFTILSTLIVVIMLGLSNIVAAQEFVTNGDLEAWDNTTTPTSWDKAENITQETTIVHGDTYSAKQQAGTSDLMQNVSGIVGGESYTISYYYLDNDVDARSRIWSYWTVGGTTIPDNAAELRSSIYSTDDPAWQLWTVTLVAPATADGFRLEVRSYNDNAGSGFIYYDDLSVFGGGAATPTISKAYAISDTELEVLYTVDVTTVNASDYSLTGTSAITFSSATIDGSNPKLVHLTGPSVNMVGDITLDNIADAASTSDFDFYAGIMPVSNANTTNPGGIVDNVHFASYLGIVSANDGYNNVWMSDAAGERNGVLIFDYDFDASVSVGDEIIIFASRTVYNGLTELVTPDLISINSSGNSPYGPSVIDGSDIDETIPVDTDPGEKWEGQLVTIQNFTVDSYVDYDYTCSWSDGTNTYIFHIGDNVDYHLSNISLNVGETYPDITGVVDWYNSGPYYRINPRDQGDIAGGTTAARIVGSMNGWSTTDPDYVMSLNANNLYELTKSLDAGDHEYKVLEGDDWSAPNYPGNNQYVNLTGTEDVTWKVNTTADLVTHLNPVMAGNFLSAIGGNDWDPGELMGEMTDPDGDDIFTLELTIPAGSWEGKVTLNHNWDQSTGGNVPFTTDGVNPTTFTYDFPNNVTTISGPPPPTTTITFIVEDTANMNYDGFFLKGSWDANGQYDPSWGGGAEHSEFYDDGTNGDAVAGDHIWTCQQDLVVDNGSNIWEWGVNDTEHNWIAGNWQFTIPDQTPQTLIWLIPDVVDLVINEIMYNSPGADEEWIELYNNTGQTIDLENWDICDDNASHTHIIIPAGHSIAPDGYFTISITTNGAFPFTPDFDGTGNFALNNGGDAVRIWNPDHLLVDIVVYDDNSPWPTEPDGDGPTLSLIQPNLDNSLGESWAASNQDIGTPGEYNFPIIVTAPNGGEVIETGTTFDITWTVESWTGNVNIELIRDGHDPELIVSNLSASAGSFSWYVFETTDPANDYKILISDNDDGDPYDESDDYFSIVEGYDMPELVITEIMYNPPESGNDSLEFIEIYNNGDETVNMDGFQFTAGVEFTFPNVDLLPDNYLLVSINSAAMMGTFGVDAYEWTGGALSNGGEKIELSDDLNNVIDSLTYDDQLPWDTLADGQGPSLTLCNPDSDNSIAENWTHSVNFAAVNAVGDSIWATPGSACQVEFLPGFVSDVTLISVGDSVLFTDQTIGNPIEWTWTFEGGTPDTYYGETPPYIVYNEVGTWDVTLLVSDGTNTGEVTYEDYIEVVDFAAPTNLQAVVGPYDDVQLTWNAPAASGFEDDFESYDDFVLEFLPWTNVDVDGSTTYGMTGIDWPNAYSEQAFIIFNPSQTTPPVDDVIPHSGDKIAACFAATAPPNDDWMITPMVGIEGGYNVSFWAKSYTDDYGLERFRVGVSTTGLDPADFTIISPGDYVEAPVADWTEFSYDLASYAGQSIYVAIQCVSNDAFILLIDDFYIGASKSSIVYNQVKPVVGKVTRDISYVVTPASIPELTSQTQRNVTADLLGYNVYRDDVQINTAIVEVTEYNDPEPTIGSHDYFVTAVYDGGESDPSNVVSVIVTDISEVGTSSVKIYPNPTDGLFTIEFDDNVVADVSIMDITGKEVYSSTLNSTSRVEIPGLQKGMYIVRLLDTSSNNLIIKKLIVR